MNKKRSEKQAEWRNQQEELRAQEHQPFMSPTQVRKERKKTELARIAKSMLRRGHAMQYRTAPFVRPRNSLCKDSDYIGAAVP